MATYTILIPLDGSDYSRRVIPYVRRLFNPQDYKLVLIHVGDDPQGIPQPPMQPLVLASTFLSDFRGLAYEEASEHRIYASRIWETAIAALEDTLRADAHELERDGYAVTVEARCGNAAEEICTYARHHPVDLVLLATHGRTGLRRLAFGSVANEVLHHATVPVMLVPPEERNQHGECMDERQN